MTLATNKRRKILQLSQDVMREKGYGGFSYADIASQLKVKNAAIHYHFPSKENLRVALLQRERRRFKKWIARNSIQEMDAWGKPDWFLSIYEHYSQGGTRVCYLGALESNFDALPIDLQTEAKGLNSDLLTWLTQLMETGQASAAFEFFGNPQAKAILLLSSLQGAVQIARVTSPSSFFAAVEQIKIDLGFVTT